MFKTLLAAALASGLLASAGHALAQSAATAAAAGPPAPPTDIQPNDYGDKSNWLCWVGRVDACASDLTTTVVKADGSTSIERFKADPNAPIDCFYVSPTVSHDPGQISTMQVEPGPPGPGSPALGDYGRGDGITCNPAHKVRVSSAHSRSAS